MESWNKKGADDIKSAIKRGEAIRRDTLRSLGELAEHKCSVCQRKVTVVNRGFGDTLVVCSHILEALQRLPKALPEPMLRSPFVSSIAGIAGLRIEVLDG